MIVVTGATGNIGRPLTRALAEGGRAGDGGVTARGGGAGRRPPRGGRPGRAGRSQARAGRSEGAVPSAVRRPARHRGQSGGHHRRSCGGRGPPGRPAVHAGRRDQAVRPHADRDARAGGHAAGVRPGVGHPAAGRLRLQRPVVGSSPSARSRLVAAPFGDVGVPIIDPADIAAVAAACLLDDRHTGRRLRADRPGGDHPAPADGGHRRRAGLAGAVPRAHPRRGQDGDGPACRRSSPTTLWTSSAPRTRPSCASARTSSASSAAPRAPSPAGPPAMSPRSADPCPAHPLTVVL